MERKRRGRGLLVYMLWEAVALRRDIYIYFCDNRNMTPAQLEAPANDLIPERQ